ncbi:hypothetical protein D3C72_1265510 [compost metagenome]
MVRKLGIKPLMQRTCQGRFFRFVRQLRAPFDVLVGNVDLPWAGFLQLSQSWHALTMNVARAREVPFQELRLDFLQMLPNPRHLISV